MFLPANNTGSLAKFARIEKCITFARLSTLLTEFTQYNDPFENA